LTATPGQKQLDSLSLKIFKGLCEEAKSNAQRSVGQILAVSAAFLSKQAHDGLANFHKLYFDPTMQEKQQQINDDVSRMFDEAHALLANGGANAVDSVKDDPERAQERIGVAHFQKQLEALITLNADFKERLVPVLSSMQFEDAMNQRLSHIDLAWTKTIQALAQDGIPDFDNIAREVAASLSSDAERKIFYPKVLKEEPPVGLGAQGMWLDLSE
jgi:hypothetical protein